VGIRAAIVGALFGVLAQLDSWRGIGYCFFFHILEFARLLNKVVSFPLPILFNLLWGRQLLWSRVTGMQKWANAIWIWTVWIQLAVSVGVRELALGIVAIRPVTATLLAWKRGI
jgi:hypothetical protein